MPHLVRLTTIAAGLAAAMLPTVGTALAQDVKLPSTLTFTAYDTGSSGFNIAVAVGKTLKDKHGTDVRVLPAGNDVARLAPLKADRAQASAMGIGTYFAQEGVFEFGGQGVGPATAQAAPLAVVDCNAISLGVAKDTGVKEVKDLKGKRVGMVVGSPGPQPERLRRAGFRQPDPQRRQAGRVLELRRRCGRAWSTTRSTPPSPPPSRARSRRSRPRRAASSTRRRPAADKEGWARCNKIGPYYYPHKTTCGAGIPHGRLGRAAGLPLSDLHDLCLAAGRPGLQPRPRR